VLSLVLEILSVANVLLMCCSCVANRVFSLVLEILSVANVLLMCCSCVANVLLIECLV
jgi:hypothetical protein